MEYWSLATTFHPHGMIKGGQAQGLHYCSPFYCHHTYPGIIILHDFLFIRHIYQTFAPQIISSVSVYYL